MVELISSAKSMEKKNMGYGQKAVWDCKGASFGL